MRSYSLRTLGKQLFQKTPRRRRPIRAFREGHFRPRIDSLEDRCLLSTFTVTNTADDGPGSLRQAITDANAASDASTIVFNIPGSPPIQVGQTTHMPLPTIRNPMGMVLDGTTQPGYSGHPLVAIDGGSGLAPGANGLEITRGYNTIRGLVISDFPGWGIVLGSDGNTVEGNYIGTNVNGTGSNPNLFGGVAVNSSNNLIGGTMIAGTSYLARNVISGNGRPGSGGPGRGIQLTNASSNRIQGNYIGIKSDGTAALGNVGTGIVLQDGCQNNLIGTDGTGTDDAAQRNVISGNLLYGVGIGGSHTGHNVVAGNYIGTGPGGGGAMPNSGVGVFLNNGTEYNVIGTNGDGMHVNADEGNLISGNSQSGIQIDGNGTNFNVVAGDYVGTNAAGNQALPNGQHGITVTNGASQNRIGSDGNDPAALLERNVISGNYWGGVVLYIGTSANVVAGNYIGTNAAGTAGLGNHRHGVYVEGSNGNRIGTDGTGMADDAERNVIAANAFDGVTIFNSGNNSVAGNYIGTDVSGTRALANGGGCTAPCGSGVGLYGGSQGNVIGVEGDGSPGDEARRNVISGNLQNGITISDSNTIHNVAAGNYIGTDATGEQALTNGLAGVAINGAGQNRIGVNVNDFTPDLERNVIGSNGPAVGSAGSYGILIQFTGATGNTVAGNYIGTDATGTVALGTPANVYGVALAAGAVNNLIGGTVPAARNVISGNLFGVVFANIAATGNQVQGNYIGTQADGVSPLGNLTDGVLFERGASGNTIGGDVSEAGNVIAYNGGSGVVVASGTANIIRLNSIFANVGLGIDLGADGVTPNQDCNAGGGPNNGQNYPVLAAAQSGDTTTITGTLNSMRNTTFTLDFYANSTADPRGYGQGQRYLGSTTVTTGDACDSDTFQVIMDAPSQDGEAISATATDPNGNTSEFSAVVDAASADSPAGRIAGLVPRLRRAADRDLAEAGTLRLAVDHPIASFLYPLSNAAVPPVLGSVTSIEARSELADVIGGLPVRRDENRSVAALRGSSVDLHNGFVPQRGDSYLTLPAGAVDGLFAKGDLDLALLRPLHDSAE